MTVLETAEDDLLIVGRDNPEKIVVAIGTSLAWLTNDEAARLRDMLAEALGEGEGVRA